MATSTPDPDDAELVQLVLSDPAVTERLRRIEERRVRGELVTHSHEEVLEHLRRRGLRRALTEENVDPPTSS